MGPLFYYELVRLARKGRGTLLRCAYALAVLLALYLAYHGRFPRHDPWREPFSSAPTLPAPELSSLAQLFVLALLRVQTLAVFVLTPVYLAAAVAEEKERHTLESLFTTQLRDREIVLGKLAARVTHLGGILLAGLPLLALTQLWGGVDIFLLLAAYAMTGLSLLSVASLSILSSVCAPTTWKAMSRSYVASAVLLLFFVLVPGGTPAGLFALMSELGDQLWTADEFPVVLLGVTCHAGVALACAARAVVLLRPVAESQVSDPHARGPAASPGELEQPEADNAMGPTRRTSHLLRDHPLLWKETSRSARGASAREFEHGLRSEWPVALGIMAFATGFLSVIGFSVDYEWGQGTVGFFTRMAVVFAAGTWCAGTALRAAGSVSLERDRQTLDSLLTLPTRREAVLGAKWLGSVLRGRNMGYCLAIVATLELVNGTLHPLALPLVAAAAACQVGFWASLGLWLSVACPTTLRARVTAAVLLLAFGVSLIYRTGDDLLYNRNLYPRSALRAESLPTAVAEVGVNPLRALWFLVFGWAEPDPVGARLFGVRLLAAAGGTLAFAVCAGLLWVDACRRFRKA